MAITTEIWWYLEVQVRFTGVDCQPGLRSPAMAPERVSNTLVEVVVDEVVDSRSRPDDNTSGL